VGSQPKIDKIIASIRTGKVSQEEGFQRLLEETDIESCIRWAIRGTAKSASEQEVEDLVSTAWEEIYEGFASFDPEKGTFKGWAKTIAHHKAVDHIRAAKASPEERSLDAPIGSSEQTLGDSLRSAETPPIEWVIEKEMVETILVTLMK
jgi:RNA polymerase sigma factor (sigma-70 family)